MNKAGPLEQEAKKGNKLLPLGCNTYAEVSKFKGKTYGSVRRWFQADDGVWYRTKNGLNMPIRDMLAVLENMTALVDFLETTKPEEEPEEAEREW